MYSDSNKMPRTRLHSPGFILVAAGYNYVGPKPLLWTLDDEMNFWQLLTDRLFLGWTVTFTSSSWYNKEDFLLKAGYTIDKIKEATSQAQEIQKLQKQSLKDNELSCFQAICLPLFVEPLMGKSCNDIVQIVHNNSILL
jgi:hypothetical protein